MSTNETLPFVRGSETSELAAQTANRRKVERDRNRLLNLLRGRGTVGATDDEMQATLSLEGNTQRPRRGELLKKGLIRKTGVRRPTRTGKLADVYVAAEDTDA